VLTRPRPAFLRRLGGPQPGSYMRTYVRAKNSENNLRPIFPELQEGPDSGSPALLHNLSTVLSQEIDRVLILVLHRASKPESICGAA
jgi:hypothetical protein